MKHYNFTIGGESYEVEVGGFDGQNITVSVNGTTYEVEIESNVAAEKTPTLTRRATTAPASSAKPNTTPTAPSITQTPKLAAGGAVH